MEKTARAEVAAVSFRWDDVGSLEAIARLLPPDGDGNHADGDLLALDSHGLVAVAPPGHLVAAVGIRDAIVVTTPDATLVCRRRDAERVKELVSLLSDRGRGDLL